MERVGGILDLMDWVPPTAPASGWYGDPWEPGKLRWWDGKRWTGHILPVAPQGPAGPERPVQTAGAGSSSLGWLWAVGGAGMALLVALVVGTVLAVRSAQDDEPTSSVQTAAPPVPAPRPPYRPPGSNELGEVAVGRPHDMATQDGTRVRVTVLGVVDPVTRGSYTLRPKRGHHWVGIRMRFQALGPGAYDDSPGNGARLAAGGRLYKADVARPDGCPALPAAIDLAPGRIATGCVMFEVRRGDRPTAMSFWPSSRFAPDVGTWRLRRPPNRPAGVRQT